MFRHTIDQDLSNVFLTADDHFGHSNIIGFTNRPFRDSEQMDNALIDNWNEVIGAKDTVIHLGDLTLSGYRDAQRYLARLNGNIKILTNPWHHDKYWLEGLDKHAKKLKSASGIEVELLPPMVVLEIPELGNEHHPLAVTLCHYPLAVWDRKHYGAWHCHGHSHGEFKYDADDYAIDVGVDATNYYPIDLGGVLDYMYSRNWTN